ncbi:MAG: malto-oligosyltrehalose synthase, partial [Chthoniobacterales bacterium]
ANDVKVLGNMLDRLSEKNRWFRDFTLDALNMAVRETIACFPVYRTYITPQGAAPSRPPLEHGAAGRTPLPGQVSEEDRAVIERAVAAAKRRNPAIEESVFNFLRDILLFRFPEGIDDETRAEHVHFVLKFQQSTGPIMAKGLEDTVFYIFNRLAALNEVGGEPQQFGISVETFHADLAHYQRHWPLTMLATSTHDTKRSEDVRARLVAISEIPDLWRSAIQRWRTTNRKSKRKIEDAEAPDANEEYLLYQTLLGTWPVDAAGKAAPEASEEYVGRIQAYMAKALKEAKLNTSWIQPNEQWDSAVQEFVARILERDAKNRFVPAFAPVAEEIARLGAINSLSQAVLKMTAPGVPDIYQGNEIWDYSLVDPDNRRPVDYGRRRDMLQALDKTTPEDLLHKWPDGRIKLFATQKLLRFRREHADLFLKGSYVPLRVSGAHADSCLAFAREHGAAWILTIVPRLSSRVGFPPVGERWQDTAVELPESAAGAAARDLFTGRELRLNNGNSLAVSEALAMLPFAVYGSAR